MIAWLVQSSRDRPELARGALPAGLLSDIEREQYDKLKTDKRRRDWLLGRWAAKRLLQAVMHDAGRAQSIAPLPALDSFAIVNDPDGAPRAVWRTGTDNGPCPVSLSISHSGDHAAACVVAQPDRALGIDIERIETRPPGFAEEYFTEAEVALVRSAPAQDRDVLVTAIWSAKEATLKATRLGLTVDTRRVTCLPLATGTSQHLWRPIEVTTHTSPSPPRLAGSWRALDGYVLTVVAGAQLIGGSELRLGDTLVVHD
jgi:4'-phosphopantetheinyl transferase